MAMLAASALLGCQRTAPATGKSRAGGQDAGGEAAALITAARCGECHGKIEQEWRGSAHSRADQSPLYRAMRARAPGANCDRCHAPLRAISAADPAVAEGVTCDVCHTIAKVKVGAAGGAGFSMRLDDSVRYGPLCDAKPHYFHTMGCSPLHEKAEFCAACHDLSMTLPGGGTLAIFPEYKEWREESPGGDGMPCQTCHMPGERAEVAVGSPEREGVPNHSFRGRGDLFRRALTGRAVLHSEGGKLHISLSLSNTWAEHAVPTGLPERQILVAVEVLDSTGRVASRVERVYGRLLVDAAQHEVPFFAAVRQLSDTRIRPGETRHDVFTLGAAAAGKVRVSVAWRPISPTLAATLGVPPPPDQPMLAASAVLPLPLKAATDSFVLELRP